MATTRMDATLVGEDAGFQEDCHLSTATRQPGDSTELAKQYFEKDLGNIGRRPIIGTKRQSFGTE
jgi:hypothetical protein